MASNLCSVHEYESLCWETMKRTTLCKSRLPSGGRSQIPLFALLEYAIYNVHHLPLTIWRRTGYNEILIRGLI